MAQKVAAKGALFQVLTPGSSPEAWITVGNIQELGEIMGTKELIDVTTLDSADDYVENILGQKDSGTVQLTLVLDPAIHDNGGNTLGQLFEDDREMTFRAVATKFSPMYQARFRGIVQEYQFLGALAPNNAVMGMATIKINGKVTRSLANVA